MRLTIELLTCDLCGSSEAATSAHVVALDHGRWQVDLCPQHLAEVTAFVSRLAAIGRPPVTRRRDDAEAEWTYLESLGFHRHRGRKSEAERDALATRNPTPQADEELQQISAEQPVN